MCNHILEEAKRIFTLFLEEKGLKKTNERFIVIEEIYSIDQTFQMRELHKKINDTRIPISLQTIHNTIDLLLKCGLIHKSHGDIFRPTSNTHNEYKEENHIVLSNPYEVLQFEDERIEEVKKILEDKFNIEIKRHSFYVFGERK